MRTVRCPLLVGRGDELRGLSEFVAGAAAGSGGSAFVLGEAGIGKSRLLAAIADVARSRDMTVLRGRAASSSAPAPYRPLAEALLSALRGQEVAEDPALARYRPALGVLVPGAWDADGSDDPSVMLLGEATLALLERCSSAGGTVVLLEDLQWAGAETCELIDYLVDKLGDRPVALVASVRTGALSEAARLAEAVAARRHGLVVRLSRLDAAGVGTMVGAALGTGAAPAGLADVVSTASGGVPFLVEELLASLIQTGAVWRDGQVWKARPALPTLVPASFETMVAERLAGLSRAGRAVVDAAAVLGERFDWELLSRIADLSPDDVAAGLDEAARAQLIEEVSGGGPVTFRFRHGLSRAAVVEAVGTLRRQILARRALALLGIEAAEEFPAGVDLELVSDLALTAGDSGLAARALIAAAVGAARVGAYVSARRSAELAATLATGLEEAVAANEVIVEASAACGDAARAAEVADQLLAQLERIGADAARVAHVHLRLASAAVEATDWPRAEGHVGQVAKLLPDPPPLLRARTDLLRTSIALGRHEPHAAVEHAERARRAADETGDPLLLAETAALLGRAHRVIDPEAARRAFTEALAAAERTGSPLAVARAAHELATLDVLFAGPTTAMERARAQAVEAGALALTASADLQLGVLHFLHYDVDAARSALQRAQEAGERYQLGLLGSAAAALLGATEATAGRRQEAVALFQQHRDGMDEEIEATARGHNLAISALVAEDRAGALAELHVSCRMAPPFSDVARAPHCGMRVLLLVLEGDTAAAGEAEALSADPAVVGVPRAFTDLALAVLAGRAGDGAAAAARAEEAFAEMAVTPWFLALGQRLVAEAALEDGWGEPGRWLGDAHRFFEGAGLGDLVEACRRLLRSAGSSPPRPPAEGQHPGLARLGITRRESEVLELLAEGRSNREIAERLYLSVRTVEKHVERLLTKTSSGTRVHLAAWAHQLGRPDAGT